MMRTTAAQTRAWTAATVDAPQRWHYPIDRELLANLRAVVAVQPSERPATDMRLNADQREAWSEAVAPALRDLEEGRGFVILDRLPLERMSQREAVALYWLIGQLLGEPFEQNVQGTLLYDVRDTGQEVSAGARFSVTSYESSFHTDNSFGDSVLDYVGLLCLKSAKSGGISQNVSGHAAIDVLRREHPDVLEVLSQPLHVDRRGGFPDGESPTVLRPVVAWDDGPHPAPLPKGEGTVDGASYSFRMAGRGQERCGAGWLPHDAGQAWKPILPGGQAWKLIVRAGQAWKPILRGMGLDGGICRRYLLTGKLLCGNVLGSVYGAKRGSVCGQRNSDPGAGKHSLSRAA